MSTRPEDRGEGTFRGLVVGIDDYVEPNRDLPSCVADAHAMASLLRSHYGFDDIRELHDADATLTNLQSAFGELISDASPDDRIVFFFSGHGAQLVKDGVLRECLVAHDLELLEDDMLVLASAALPRGVLTVALDACFAGGMWRGLGPRKSISLNPISKDLPTSYRPFGGPVRPHVGPFLSARKTIVVRRSPAELDQDALNGLLVGACLENETAAASTPRTSGLSAFTFALTKAIAALGPHAPAAAVVDRAADELRAVGVDQTPQLHDPDAPATMSAQTLFDVSVATADVTLAAPAAPPADEAPSDEAPSDDETDTDDLLSAIASASAKAAMLHLNP